MVPNLFKKDVISRTGISFVTGIFLSATAIPVSLAFIDLFGPYTGTVDFSNALWFVVAPLAVSFFAAFVAGWYIKKGYVYPAVIFLTYYLAESIFRAIRLGNAVTLVFSFVKFWGILDLPRFLVAIGAGIFLGTYVGFKARREEHDARFYVFAPMSVVLVLVGLFNLGGKIFIPFIRVRGVL